MRSIFAALRILVLPYGATSGKRLILDGIAGVMRAFNATGTQSASVDGDGFHVAGPNVEMDLVLDSGAPTVRFTDPTKPVPAFWEGRADISAYTGTSQSYGVAIRSGNDVANANSEHSVLVVGVNSLTLSHTDTTGSVISGSALILLPDSILVDMPMKVDGETWHNVVLQNGWANRAGLDPLQYRKLPDGTVHLRGTISGGTSASGTRIGSVPAGYRPPTHDTVFPISSDNQPAAYAAANGTARLQVQLGGDLFIYGTGVGPLWIDGRWTTVA